MEDTEPSNQRPSAQKRPNFFSELPPLLAVTLFFLVVGTIFLIIGLSSKRWITSSGEENLSFGPWTSCYNAENPVIVEEVTEVDNVTSVRNQTKYVSKRRCGSTGSIGDWNTDGWVKGLQISLVLSAITLCCAVIVNALAVVLPSMHGHLFPPFFVSCASFGTVILQLVAIVIVVAHKLNNGPLVATQFNWAFGLHCTSLCACCVSMFVAATQFYQGVNNKKTK